MVVVYELGLYSEAVNKKWQTNIAPLQPPTLATFRSWGNSAGAGRAGLPGAKVQCTFDNWQFDYEIFCYWLLVSGNWQLETGNKLS
jgi:hypothetical protein